jgi:hypothetical protein
MVTGTIWAHDEYLPTVFYKSAALGDGDDNAQPDCGRGFLAS